jgi:hypothetical protein
MANPDRPNGLEVSGAPLRINTYIAAGAIYPGDPVRATAAGKVERAPAGSQIRGAAVSFAAADGAEVQVADHPDQQFKIQADSDDIDALAELNKNYDFATTTSAFSATYKLSRVELDSDSGAADADLPLRLLAISRERNNALGDNVKCIVRIINHEFDAGVRVEVDPTT